MSTPDRKVTTSKLIKNTRKKIRKNPERRVGKLALASDLSYGTIRKVLTSDLKFSPFIKTQALPLRGQKKVKLRDGTQPPVLQKLFTIQSSERPYLCSELAQYSTERQASVSEKKPAYVMVWVRKTLSGRKISRFFIEEIIKMNQ